MKFVLQTEIKEARIFRKCEDTLGHPFAPYYVVNEQGRDVPKISRRFFKYSSRQLDPFSRFSYRDQSLKEMVSEDWSTSDSLGGRVFEALVACHIIHSKACKSCFCKNVLRYNGGLDEVCSWSDIVCIKCNATYEIKSKKDPEAIQKSFQYGFRGGSFRTFAQFEQIGERYLIVVSRAPVAVCAESGAICHPVTVAKIDYVIPQISCDSFDPKSTNIPLRTIIKLQGRSQWCNLPLCTLDFWSTAKEVFEEYFGPGEWGGMETVSAPLFSESDPSLTTSASLHEKGVDEIIQKSLAKLELSDDEVDDWEDRDSGSEN